MPENFAGFDAVRDAGSSFILTKETIKGKKVMVVNQTFHGGEWISEKTLFELKHIAKVVKR